MAQAIRAILLASAIAATLVDRLVSNALAADDHLAAGINPVDLENRLGDV